MTSTSDKTGLDPVLLVLPSLSPSLAVETLPYGATIHRILVNGDGKTHDLLIGPHDKNEHRTRRMFLHTIVGRYANRIPAGDHTLEKNGVKALLSVTGNEKPEVTLHGGADGFDRRVFETVSGSETGGYHLFSKREKEIIQGLPASTVFKLTSPARDQGFPGELYVEVLLALVEPKPAPTDAAAERELGSLIIVYRARLTEGQPKTITPVNLTQHWGFNLDASLATGPGQPTPGVEKHELIIKSSHTVGLDDNALATGELISTAGTPYEHNGKPIEQAFPKAGYDEYYTFDQPRASPSRVPLHDLSSLDVLSGLASSAGATDEPLVALRSEQSGIRLTFETNQPGVQLYTTNFPPGVGSRKRIHGGAVEPVAEDGYKPQAATFLEFHEPLAAWMHPWGQTPEKDTLLTSEELYNNFTKLNVYFKPVEQRE